MIGLSQATTAAERSLVIERVFDAPPELVFEAWTKPEHLTKWWGPNDFTLPHCEVDFRVGGRYRFCMRSPDGEDHWVWGVYEEIVPPERLVFTWNREDATGRVWSSSSVVRATFTEQDGKTLFTLNQALFETPAYCGEHQIGWSQSLDRLGTYMESI